MDYIGEANDLGIVNWKRIRLALEHENSLLNNRMTWLITTQGFLLTACGIIFGLLLKDPQGAYFKNEAIIIDIVVFSLCIISVAAIFISYYLSRGIKAAQDQHFRLQLWWENHGGRASNTEHPPICGCEPIVGVRVPYYRMPYIFIAIWGIILFFVARFLVSSTSLEYKVTIINSALVLLFFTSLYGIYSVFLVQKEFKSAPAQHHQLKELCHVCKKFCSIPQLSPWLSAPGYIAWLVYLFYAIWGLIFFIPIFYLIGSNFLTLPRIANLFSLVCFIGILISVGSILGVNVTQCQRCQLRILSCNCENEDNILKKQPISCAAKRIKLTLFIFIYIWGGIVAFFGVFYNQDLCIDSVSGLICKLIIEQNFCA